MDRRILRLYLELWGKAKADTFKDGGVVHAVVWNEPRDTHDLRLEPIVSLGR